MSITKRKLREQADRLEFIKMKSFLDYLTLLPNFPQKFRKLKHLTLLKEPIL